MEKWSRIEKENKRMTNREKERIRNLENVGRKKKGQKVAWLSGTRA